MTPKNRFAAALLASACVLPLPVTGSGSPVARALQAPQAPAQPLLLAQQRDRDGNYLCELDGRNVPRGMTKCVDGYVQVCNARGTWDRTTRRC